MSTPSHGTTMMKKSKLTLLAVGASLLASFPALADNAGPIAQQASPSAQNAAPNGEHLYRTICQACHMANGKGGVGAAVILPLADNPKLEFPGYPISIVLHGYGAMPAVGGYLTDDQIAALLTFVRSNFGNHYTDPVTPAMVKELRPEDGDYPGGM